MPQWVERVCETEEQGEMTENGEMRQKEILIPALLQHNKDE